MWTGRFDWRQAKLCMEQSRFMVCLYVYEVRLLLIQLQHVHQFTNLPSEQPTHLVANMETVRHRRGGACRRSIFLLFFWPLRWGEVFHLYPQPLVIACLMHPSFNHRLSSFSGRCFLTVGHCHRTSPHRHHWLFLGNVWSLITWIVLSPNPLSAHTVTLSFQNGHYNKSFYLLSY